MTIGRKNKISKSFWSATIRRAPPSCFLKARFEIFGGLTNDGHFCFQCRGTCLVSSTSVEEGQLCDVVTIELRLILEFVGIARNVFYEISRMTGHFVNVFFFRHQGMAL